MYTLTQVLFRDSSIVLHFSVADLQLEYGTTTSDVEMQQADDSCLGEIDVNFPIPFRGKTFRKLYVRSSCCRI